MLASVGVSPIEIVGVVVAVLGFLFIAKGNNAITRAFKGASMSSVTSASANAAVALAARVEQLERSDLIKDKQIAALQEENKLLRELVTHTAKLDAVLKRLDEIQTSIDGLAGVR